MELHAHPVSGQKNKVLVTEEKAYFCPVVSGDAPRFVDILAEVFDLGNPEVMKVLDEMFDSGTLILGYLKQDGGFNIHVPLEQDEYVEKRLQEVLGG